MKNILENIGFTMMIIGSPILIGSMIFVMPNLINFGFSLIVGGGVIYFMTRKFREDEEKAQQTFQKVEGKD